MASTSALEVGPRRRAQRLATWLALLAALAAVAAWYSSRPPALPTSGRTVSATTPVGVPVYIGMFAAPNDFGRRLSVDGVKVRATATAAVSIVPLLCRGGSVAVTSTPDPFCVELRDPQGATLGTGDSLVLEVTAESPSVVVVDRVRVGYQDGVRAGTQDAGVQEAVIRVLDR